MFDYSRHAARLAAIEERQEELLATLEELHRRVEGTLREARLCLAASDPFFTPGDASKMASGGLPHHPAIARPAA